MASRGLISRGGGFQREQVLRIERRVVGHDRDELAFEDLVDVGRCGGITEEVEVELVACERALEREEGPSMERRQAKRPDRMVEQAVKGMLPKNKLGRAMALKLKVYAGDRHPHEAQQPVVSELK